MTDPKHLIDGVAPLGAQGEHITRWELQLRTMAESIDALDVLKGDEVEPLLSTMTLRAAPAALSDDASAAALKTYNDEHEQVTKFNDRLRKQYKDEVSTRKEWRHKDASIRKVILATIPMHLLEAVRTHVNAHQMYEAIRTQYRQDGLTEKITVYQHYHNLTADSYPTAVAFCEKFQAALARMKEFKLQCPEEEQIFRFLGALEPAMPEYCRDRREDIRRDRTLVLQDLIREICDEARTYNDPFKSTYATAQMIRTKTSELRNSRTTIATQQTPQQKKDKKAGGNNNSGGDKDKQPYTPCTECGSKHKSGSAQCYLAHPELATEAWRVKNADRIRTFKSKKTTAATHVDAIISAVSLSTQMRIDHQLIDHRLIDHRAIDYSLGNPIDDFADTYEVYEEIYSDRAIDQAINQDADRDVDRAIELSAVTATVTDDLIQRAHDLDLRDHIILDTGSDSHVFNNRAKFVSLNLVSGASGIRTGAGMVPIEGVGTVKLSMAKADGSVQRVRLTDVVYCKSFFLNVISHSKLRSKGLFYHGWDQKIYIQDSNKKDIHEVAYCPTINGIPHVLEASTTEQAAQALTFAGVYDSATPPAYSARVS
jgi:hypothetical protein